MNRLPQVWFVQTVQKYVARVLAHRALLLLSLHYLRESNGEFLFLFTRLLSHLCDPGVIYSLLQVERALIAVAQA